jgi:hypothetical protein
MTEKERKHWEYNKAYYKRRKFENSEREKQEQEKRLIRLKPYTIFITSLTTEQRLRLTGFLYCTESELASELENLSSILATTANMDVK